MHGIDIPAGANTSNPKLLGAEVSEVSEDTPNKEWRNIDDEDMNVAEAMLGLAGKAVSL